MKYEATKRNGVHSLMKLSVAETAARSLVTGKVVAGAVEEGIRSYANP